MDGSGIELNNASWSLIHEMRLAIVVPFIALAIRQNWIVTLGAMWMIAAASAVYQRLYVPLDAAPWWPNTIVYAALFATGAALALAGRPLVERLGRLRGMLQAALIVASLLILSESHIGLFPIRFGKPFIGYFLEGVAASLLLAFAMTNCWMTRVVLNHPIPVYLGRISYSLYLVHLVVLQTMVRLLDGLLPHWATIALVFPVAIAVAHVLRETLETGSQSLGRRLARLVARDQRVAEGGFGKAG